MLFVYCGVHKNYIFPFASPNHEDIIDVLNQLVVWAGSVPHRVLTDFDNKLLDGNVSKWYREHQCKLTGVPGGRQNQNGLVERAWTGDKVLELGGVANI